jgi:2'-5' RNA ligase
MLDEVNSSSDVLYGPSKQILIELEEALTSNKTIDIYNHVHLLQSLQTREHPLYNYFCQFTTAVKLLNEAREHIENWRRNLKIGDHFDKFTPQDGVG